MAGGMSGQPQAAMTHSTAQFQCALKFRPYRLHGFTYYHFKMALTDTVAVTDTRVKQRGNVTSCIDILEQFVKVTWRVLDSWNTLVVHTGLKYTSMELIYVFILVHMNMCDV